MGDDNRVDDVKRLREVASQSLRANLVTHDSGTFLRAGAHHFASLWTRDFAYAVPGLCAIGERAAAEHHLSTILKQTASDGLVPRILERGSSAWTVLKWTLFRPLQMEAGEKTDWRGSKLKAEYLGEHGTRALDAGLLVLLASFSMANPGFLSAHHEELKKVFRYYETLTGGWRQLLTQDEFEDWQDSARRSGCVSYCNLLLLWVLHHAQRFEWVSPGDLARMTALFNATFARVNGLIPLRSGGAQIALETQLHAIEMGLEFPSWRTHVDGMWKDLKRSDLWLRGLGLPIHPRYHDDEISFFTKAVGLRHYHDAFRWTWLIAETGRIALLFNDLEVAEVCASELVRSLGPQGVGEILELKTPQPVRTWTYRSEAPFSWGAARTLQFCDLWSERVTASPSKSSPLST